MVEAFEKRPRLFSMKPKMNLKKFMFVLSDGNSTDGYPRPTAKQLCDSRSGVTIACNMLPYIIGADRQPTMLDIGADRQPTNPENKQCLR